MPLAVDQIESIVGTIHKEFPEPSSQDLSLAMQEYLFAGRLMQMLDTEEDTGDTMNWKVEIDYDDNFQIVGLYHEDTSDRVDILDDCSLKWGMSTTNYHYDIDEQTFKKGADSIFNYIEAKERGLLKSYYAGMENYILGSGPTSTTIRPFPPLGLLWWITATSDSTTDNNATEGFTGAEPLGWGSAGVAGLSTSDYSVWKNRAFPYTQVNDTDLVEKTVNSMDFCLFKPMIDTVNVSPPTKPRWEILTTHSVIVKGRRLASSKNDNHGNELAKYGNGILIRGVGMNWVPAWTNSSSILQRTDGVVLGLDWSSFKWCYNSGRKMRKHPAFPHPLKSNVRIRKMDDAGQLKCYDRRRNFRGYSTVTVTETD